MCPKDMSLRLPRDRHCPIQQQSLTLNESWLDTICCQHCRHPFEKSSRSNSCEKLPKTPILLSAMHISLCFLARTICCTPLITRWKAKESTASLTTQRIIGRSKKLLTTYFRCWSRRNRTTLNSVVRLSRTAR